MLTFAAAMLVSFLPARHWSRFSSLPVHAAAPLAGILTLVAAGLGLIAGFMAYAAGVMQQSGELQMAIAERQLKGELAHDAAVSSGPMAVAMLAPLAFLFLTPTGQITGYLAASSLMRTLAWILDGPVGDPALTAVDAMVSRVRERTVASHRRRTRERAEGPPVPDRRYSGSWAGLDGVDLVIVSARRKDEWRRGVTIIAGEDCFSLGEPFDLQTADGLRTAYPLTRQRLTEVVRHAIYYDLPPATYRS